jgi:hypothetical protein
MPPIVAIAALLALAPVSGIAHAAACAGRAPAGATEFRGPVLEVLDGARLCVAVSEEPSSWVEVRLADAPHAPTRGALMAASFGQDVTCRFVAEAAGEPLAMCRSRNGSVGRLSGEPAIVEAGRSWR